jgi:hypothetical protein
MIEDNYDPLLVSFIIDFSDKFADDGVQELFHVKKSIIKVLEKAMEPEDKAYIFHEDALEIPERRCGVHRYLGMVNFDTFDLSEGIRQSLHLMSMQNDYQYRQYVFIITNRYDSKNDEYGCKKMQSFDERYFWDCTFIFCGIGDYDKELKNLVDNHPRTLHWHFDDADELESKMVEYVDSLTGIEYLEGSSDGENVSKE